MVHKCSLLASLALIHTSSTDLVGGNRPSHLTSLTYRRLAVPCMAARTRTSRTRTPSNKCINSLSRLRPRRLSSLVRRLRMQGRVARVSSQQRRTRVRVKVMGRPRLVAPARVRVCTTYCRSMDGVVFNVTCEIDSMRIVERDVGRIGKCGLA